MVLIIKGVIFGVKVLAKIKPGAKVTFKLGFKGTAYGLLAVTPLGEVIVFVALTSLSGIAISIAATFIISKLVDRGLVYVWDEGLTKQFPDLNTTGETSQNLATVDLETGDIPTLAFPPTRRKVARETLTSSLETGLGRELTTIETVAFEVVQIGFNLLPGPIQVYFLVGLSFAAQQELQEQETARA